MYVFVTHLGGFIKCWYIILLELISDVMQVKWTLHIRWPDPPPSKKTFLIDFCGSPVFEKKRCKQTGFSNYSCNYGMGIQNSVNTGKSTGLSQLTVMVSGWDSCSSLPQCTVTTAMGNHFVLLNFNLLLLNSSLKYHQEWQYLAMAENPLQQPQGSDLQTDPFFVTTRNGLLK